MADALYPPDPEQLLADLQALGLDGCWVYVWRPGGIGSWTAAHVAALRAAGRRVGGIIVPGDAPGAPGPMVAAAAALGLPAGCPLAEDTETTSEPPLAWSQALYAAIHAAGHRAIDYGLARDLARYDAGDDGDWLASWERTGVLKPVPELQPGQLAWQFVDDVRGPSGALYDVSVVDPALFGGEMLDPNDPIVKNLLATLGDVAGVVAKLDQRVLGDIGDPAAPAGAPDVGLGYLSGRVDELLTAVGGLAKPQVDVQALAAELATVLGPKLPPGTDAAAVAGAVIAALGQRLAPA